ncbi:MAG: A/G-specific adenine glycosylase [Deferribacteres bacterium]|nr:A/G-specific adenine glycosylase [candidate division KSB1 bacterium]MCB9503003.1 A/G-specific adenine glycosylase [Deferribacteres bacterium]
MENTIDINIIQFRSLLLQWYQSEKRDLPWRRESASYEIWISEVMLQQTQVKKVQPYYLKFIRIFPNVYTLAKAQLDDVLKIWEGLGYYTRARNLHKAANYIVEHENGTVPTKYDKLLSIPGIGEYTAAAVASIAGNETHAVVDGNVIRVLSRLFQIEGPTQIAVTKQRLKELAERLLSRDYPGDYNQAMMELGALICTPRKPKCLLCPVVELCKAHRNLPDPSLLPVKKKRKEAPHHNIAVAILWDEGHIFITKREENGVLGGMWDFPGVMIGESETPQHALQKLLQEKYNLYAEATEFLVEIKHAFSHYKMTLQVFHCLYKSGEAPTNANSDWQWVKPEELKFFPFAAANKKIIQKLENDFVHT